MARVPLFFWGLTALVSVLWFVSDSLWVSPFAYFPFRSVFVQFSGILAVVMMAVALVLALRLRSLERWVGGLDKVYRLHKWLGIGSLVLATLHWWWAKGTKWMVGWGWLEKPAGKGAGQQLAGLEAWFRGQRGLAETLGEWAFYAAAVLIVLALVKAFPYHLFRKTHKLLAVVFLPLAWHSFILMKFDYWAAPIGWLTQFAVVAGSIAAVLLLLGWPGKVRKVPGEVVSVTRYPELRVFEFLVRVEQGWSVHNPGQFAFITSDAAEGPHPYTIASDWNPETRCLKFVVKELGDHTRRASHRICEGMPVTLEGPYGGFDFEDDCRTQIWVGAGIGITPFIARMGRLASKPDNRTIYLFHPTADVSEEALTKLRADAEAAGVNLVIRCSRTEGRLTPEEIRDAVPDWQGASLWFCGPVGMARTLFNEFRRWGLPARRMHREFFEMR
ncbi:MULTISPECIES: ferredoxin reductase family protein [Marinobacter]|jgi:predicted ferric reductase|uniref:ferredoxin reductase family protein n=1 Tax=Marinobacter TaxID=2742 RepID=UPI0002ED8561|nr:ferric reductase-like transmembrane domain-containing protein [Marinobacter nauticus]MCG8520920.1 ferric reductase-like transmembrane domain-containing protein [Pseudomonadales bacterium]MBY5960850.1 ferric reductase-like transmembrane domain-containing protein [Marinobacter nauticus]MBY6104241.1 ferric reductase-like transmembrane domain-containing protein [Marinobacter nauticus]MCC4270012.1 ferric reductase-like transmembrane domain-containing protein [Marinobacter nauticus]TPW24361.1 fer